MSKKLCSFNFLRTCDRAQHEILRSKMIVIQALTQVQGKEQKSKV
ncbi:hypothetical protein [Neolewinella lacunae]|nr:hypothetical protein [Neolewinella lacunae]